VLLAPWFVNAKYTKKTIYFLPGTHDFKMCFWIIIVYIIILKYYIVTCLYLYYWC